VLSFASAPGQSFLFSVFKPRILEELSLSETQFSLIYTLGTGFSALMVSVLGRSIDRFGLRSVLFIIALLFLCSCIGMSIARSFVPLLLALASLRALGQGSLVNSAQILTSQWFIEKRSFALSLVSMGIVLAGIIMPPLMLLFINAYGWRETYLLLGIVISSVIALLSWKVIRNTPESIGLHPDGHNIAPEEPLQKSQSEAATQVWKTAIFWNLVIPLTAVPLITTALIFHQVAFFKERGLDEQASAFVLSIVAIAAAVSTASSSRLISFFGMRNCTALLSILLLLSLIAIWFTQSLTLAIVYGVFLGFANGLSSVLYGATWPHYYGRKNLGTIQGTAGTIILSAAAVAPLPVAVLNDHFSTTHAAISLLAMWALLCLGLALQRKRKQRKRKNP